MPHSKIYISVGHFCNFEKWKRATMFAAFPNIHLRDGQSTADRPTARLLQEILFYGSFYRTRRSRLAGWRARQSVYKPACAHQ